MCDGVYDPWGEFPELQAMHNATHARIFPTLSELRELPYVPGDHREVVLLSILINLQQATLNQLSYVIYFSSTVPKLMVAMAWNG